MIIIVLNVVKTWWFISFLPQVFILIPLSCFLNNLFKFLSFLHSSIIVCVAVWTETETKPYEYNRSGILNAHSVRETVLLSSKRTERTFQNKSDKKIQKFISESFPRHQFKSNEDFTSSHRYLYFRGPTYTHRGCYKFLSLHIQCKSYITLLLVMATDMLDYWEKHETSGPTASCLQCGESYPL